MRQKLEMTSTCKNQSSFEGFLSLPFTQCAFFLKIVTTSHSEERYKRQ